MELDYEDTDQLALSLAETRNALIRAKRCLAELEKFPGDAQYIKGLLKNDIAELSEKLFHLGEIARPTGLLN